MPIHQKSNTGITNYFMTKNKRLLGVLGALLIMLFMSQAKAAPQIEQWTTDKGLQVYYVAVSDIPMLDMHLIFAAGSAYDGDKAGLAALTSQMLASGSEGMSADQMAEAFDEVGAIFSSGAARDSAWVTLRTLTQEKEREQALDTWLKALKPTFPAKEFKDLQKLTLVGLAAEKQNPSEIASKAFAAALYGNHPYGQAANGTEDSINALTLADLKQFYQQFYVASNAALTIVGAVDRAMAERIANQASAVLEQGNPAPELPEVIPFSAEKMITIPYPSEQSHILLGSTSMKRTNPDRYALALGNHILGGGGFSARLMKEIRKERGLSYGAYSFIASMKQLGTFQIALQTKQDKTEEALQAARDLLRQFLSEGPTEAELVAAKKDLTGGFPMSIASNAAIAGQVSHLGFYQLPLNSLDVYTDKINALTREQVLDAFKRYIDADKMLTVIVGSAKLQAQDEQAEPAAKKP